jgi:multiple sugar transport system permease protein
VTICRSAGENEVAEGDDASTLRTFSAGVVRVRRNSPITVALLAFLRSARTACSPRLDREGGSLRPATVGIYDCIGARNPERGPMMATEVIAPIPAALLLVLTEKLVAAGVTAGAVKD